MIYSEKKFLSKSLIGILLFYLSITLIIIHPILFQFTTNVLGNEFSDIYSHLWCMWWGSNSLLITGCLPTQTDLINFPAGGTLYSAFPLDTIITLPVYIIWGTCAAYNSIIFFHLMLSSTSGFLLSFYLTKNKWTSIVSGIICGFSPYILTHAIESGEAELAGIGWIILFILFFLKTIREKSYINPVLCGLFLFLSVFANIYYGIFIFIFIFLFCLFFIFIFKNYYQELTLYTNKKENNYPNKALNQNYHLLTLKLFIACLIAIVLISPFAISLKKTLKKKSSILSNITQREDSSFIFFNPSSKIRRHSTLLDYFQTGKKNLHSVKNESNLLFSSYIGYTIFILSLLAILQRKKLIYFFLFISIFFIVLSLGPYLQLSNNFSFLTPINFIFIIMFKYFPYFSGLISISRFAAMAIISISILVSSGLSYLSTKLNIKEKIICPIAVFLILTEFFILSPAPFPTNTTLLYIPQHVTDIAKESESFGVIDFPITVKGSSVFFKKVLFYQTIHGKPILHRISMIPDLLISNNFLSLIFSQEQSIFNPLLNYNSNITSDIKSLRKMNFKYIVLHRKYYNDIDYLNTKKILNYYLGSPLKTYPNDEIEVYIIE